MLHDAPALPAEARWFEETSQFWREPIDVLLDRLVAVIEAMKPTVNVLVSEHIAARDPVVIEGRQLDPSMIARHRFEHGTKGIVLLEDDEDRLGATLLKRSAAFRDLPEEGRRTIIGMNISLSRWLRDRAQAFEVSCVAGQPWSTSSARAVSALGVDALPRRDHG